MNRLVTCLLSLSLSLSLLYSPLTLGSSTTYAFEATIRILTSTDSFQLTSEEAITYLESEGIFIDQVISGTISLTPLSPDPLPNNNTYFHFDAFESGAFTIGGYIFEIDTNSVNSLIAFNDSNLTPFGADVVGLSGSLLTDLPVDFPAVSFMFTDLSGTAVSDSDVPEYPIELDDYSPFDVLPVSGLTTGVAVSFSLEAGNAINIRAEFDSFTPVPLPGGLALLIGAMLPLFLAGSKGSGSKGSEYISARNVL